MPAPKHLMYAEAESQYRVDARFMAHVNDNMLTSTIFDPSQYPGKLLDSMFKAVFAKAACLRICVLDQFKRVEVSFFGPKVQPIFNDQARKWPTWFKRAEYTAKVLGVTAPKKATEAVQGAAPVQAPQPIQQPPSQTVPEGNEFVHVAECGTNEKAKIKETMGPGLSKQLDLLTLNLPCPEMSVASALQSALTPERPKAESERPYSPPVSPPSFESDKYGYQMKLLWDFVYSSARTGQDGSRPTSTAGAKAAATKGERNNDTAKSKINDAPAEAEPLISMLDDEAPSTGRAGTSTFGPDQDNLLIQIDAPPRSASPPLSEQLRPVPVPGEKPRSVLPIGTGMSKALVRRSTFASGLCNSIGRLMADLPYSRGRIRLQVELGRLYIMDADPEGLAYNAPGEAASGWPHTEIITRLDTICVSPESIVFTKALTLFANDIESVLGSNAVVPSRGIVGDGGDVFGGGSERSSTSSSEWTFHEKRIVYEFKCQRHFLTSTGVVKVQSPFVVEIDGTEAGAFTYNIRRVEDTRPPIWIHCIRRHWDARVTVSYSQTDKLEEVYGEFARELLRTMVVPYVFFSSFFVLPLLPSLYDSANDDNSPRPITCPKFQVAYDHRETEKDGRSFFTKVVSTRVRNVGRFVSDNKESFLDVSWNHHMALEMKPGKETAATGTIRATLAVDNPGRGLFTSWYEASVVSAVAETAFRENETLPVGGMAVWGSGGGGKQDELYEAAFGPALRLVQKMDGVGVLIDNGQGDVLWTPPVKADQAVLAVQKFW